MVIKQQISRTISRNLHLGRDALVSFSRSSLKRPLDTDAGAEQRGPGRDARQLRGHLPAGGGERAVEGKRSGARGPGPNPFSPFPPLYFSPTVRRGQGRRKTLPSKVSSSLISLSVKWKHKDYVVTRTSF